MYQSYNLSRYIDGDTEHGTTITVSDDDAINCAHMLAAGFNTISRNMMGDFVLGVVDTKAGTVQYDGKVEQIKRAEPWSYKQTFKFEPSTDADTILRMFTDDGKETFSAFGKLKPEPEAPREPQSKYAHINRDVLEEAYAEMQAVKSVVEEVGVETIPLSSGVREMQYMIEARDVEIAELEAVKNVLFDAGVETIPADAGVRDLLAVKRDMSAQISARDVEIAELVQRRANQNAAARDELIEFTRGAYEKLCRVDPEGHRDDLQHRYRGMLDVLANLLVAIGEADRDERHAVARRLVEKPGN